MLIEGVEGCKGNGYSKKESQQEASKLTLQRLRREPQYIDAVFAAKTNRTKMEETPTETVPDTEPKDDFIIEQKPIKPIEENTKKKPTEKTKTVDSPQDNNQDHEQDEFDLSDITATPKEMSRESIIAAAEEAAFAME